MSKPIVVKFKKDKNLYEVLTHHGMVEPFKEGKIGWNKVPFADAIYKDSTKGDKYTDAQLKSAFGTSNIEECMKIIVIEGELQLTIADRKRKLEELRRQIVNEIHKYYLDPKTMKAHPVILLESAIEKTKVKITLDQPFQKQVDVIVKKLPEFIAIRKSTMEGKLFIPNIYVGKTKGIISKYATEEGSNYNSEGCVMRISVVPGCYDNLMIELNSATKGEAVFTVDGASATAPSSTSFQSNKELKKQKKKGNRNQVPSTTCTEHTF